MDQGLTAMPLKTLRDPPRDWVPRRTCPLVVSFGWAFPSGHIFSPPPPGPELCLPPVRLQGHCIHQPFACIRPPVHLVGACVLRSLSVGPGGGAASLPPLFSARTAVAFKATGWPSCGSVPRAPPLSYTKPLRRLCKAHSVPWAQHIAFQSRCFSSHDRYRLQCQHNVIRKDAHPHLASLWQVSGRSSKMFIAMR